MVVKKSNNRTVINHAPLGKFNKQDDKYVASSEPKNNIKQAAMNTLFSQDKAITSDIKQVVTSIPEMIAKPVSELREERKEKDINKITAVYCF